MDNDRYIKSESGGFYYLQNSARAESYADDDGSLGTGGGMSVTRFQSAEGREYYILNEETKRSLRSVSRELRDLRMNVVGLVGGTGRVSHKRVLKLVARLKQK